MKRMQFYFNTFIVGWRWYVELYRDDEQRLQLFSALNAERPPQFWEGDAVIPMELSVLRGYADQNPEIPNPQFERLVPLQQPDGSEWRSILEWRDAGGFFKPTLGPPDNNSQMIRIVSPQLKAAMERFLLPPHRFYPVKVRHEFTGEQRDYYMFHLLGDQWTEQHAAYWPAMKYYVFDKNPRSNIREFPPGSANSREDYLTHFRSFAGQYDLKDIGVDFPYLVYLQPYDLVWGKGDMAMSAEMGRALEEEFGLDVVGLWKSHKKPILTDFDPERDQVPEDLLLL